MNCKYHLILFFLSITLFFGKARAQVTIAVQVPPTGVIQKNQLWNLVLVSTSNDPITVRIKITLLSTKDNSPVMSAVSRIFSITKGVKQIGSNDVSPIEYDYQSAIFNVDRNPNGFLPIGNFLACYTVTKIVGDAVSELSEECLLVEVAPLSPPILNTPFDRDTLTTSYPNFSWLPPAPLNLFGDLSYDLSLVEVQSGQAATQAIQENLPIYTANRLTTPTNTYPASNKALDTAKLYAWRIAANNNGQLVAQSEVWTFQVGKSAIETSATNLSSYIVIGESDLGIQMLSGNSLHIKYVSKHPSYEAAIMFTEHGNNTIQQLRKTIQTGDNYFDFSLSSRFKTGKVYQLQLPTPEGKYQTLRFTISKHQ
jgi:hypothetical protein